MAEKHELTLDAKRLWQALSRSTQIRDRLAEVAKEVRDEAARIARSEAFDEGDYEAGLEVVTASARQVKEKLRTNRSRTVGTRFDNPLLSAKFEGDPSGRDYDGTVGIVTAKDWKSSLIEFGSLARNPTFTLTRAAAKVGNQPGIEYIVLFESNKQTTQNLEEFGRVIAEKRKGGEG
jgi:hypothetical protein